MLFHQTRYFNTFTYDIRIGIYTKKYDFQVNIYGKGTPMNLITGYSCSGAYGQKPTFVLGSKYETLEKSQQILSQQYKYVKKLTLHTTNSKHFNMYDQPIWFFELDTFLK